MKIIMQSLGALVLSNSLITAMESPKKATEHSQSLPFANSIKKINDDFYVGKIKDKKLWIVMERITNNNIDDWKNYAKFQVQGIEEASSRIKGSTSDGVVHFRDVLKLVPYTTNEVWIAYVTADSNPLPSDKNNELIKMFVTVVSSPKAKITSHMGVALTLESTRTLEGPTKDISMNLHAFAASVMRMRNPARKYMVNAPAIAMELIMAKNVKEGIFIGTREMFEETEKRKTIDFETFRKLQYEDQDFIQYQEGIKRDSASELKRYKKLLNGVLAQFQQDKEAQQYLEYQGGQFVISPQKLEEENKKWLQEKFESYKNPDFFQGLKEGFGKFFKGENFEIFLTEHPPILSVKYGKYSLDTITIYDPQNSQQPWLVIEKNDPNYNWIFTEPFAVSGRTHFIAVDLQALANCRPLEDF